ncbi:abortive phage resistance protein [Pantoea eucalypti]|uniref:AbiTii domain-containing protein n=1 Tax=Pantoea eucalypti TaxID=470933 RepID=UPI003EE7528C
MSNSPVLKLQDMASTKSTDIEELLSRAKMISVKLGLDDISVWLEYEINGYPTFDKLPDYRFIKNSPIKAFNPYVGWIPYNLGDIEHSELHSSLTKVAISNPVSMLVEYAKSTSIMYCEVPSKMAVFLRDAADCDFTIAWSVTPTQVTKILSNIRSVVLDWSLALEKKKIYGEGLLFSDEEKREAVGMTINNINNFHGAVNNAGSIGAGNTGDVSQQNVINAGDFRSLEKQLKDWGIPNEDIALLHQALQKLPTPTSPDNLGSNVGKWLGDMVGKAYSGSLKIAASAAPALLTNAICHYYNIPV